MTARQRVLVFRPTLGEGGADRVTATLLRRFDRSVLQPELALLRAEGPFVGDLPKDVPVHVLGSSRLALSAPALAKVIRRVEPDVVFSTASAANVIAVAARMLARSNAALVLSERSTLYRDRGDRLKQRLEVVAKRFAYRRAQVVIAISRGLGDELVKTLGIPRDHVRVIYNPTVEEDLAERIAEPVEHPWFREGELPVILACGRLVEVKDYPTLLATFARIRAQRPCRLFVLGSGHLRDTLVARATELGIGSDVSFHGFDKNPLKYMARARLLLHSSLVEGLGSVLIQAMMCGTPVVSTDCDFGPREIVSPGVDGFLAPVGDAAALAARALQILGDDSLHDSMSTAARVSAARFTAASAVTQYEDALRDAVSARA